MTKHHRLGQTLHLDTLESREVPAIVIRVDYSLDTQGFFTDERRAAIERVTQDLGNRLDDTLTAIVPNGNNRWTATIFNTITNSNFTLTNPTIAANEIVLFVAGAAMPGQELGIASGGSWTASGSQTWLDTVRARGQAGAASATPTDISPWGGFIGFDSTINWDFSPGDPGRSQYDFDSVARHELMHILGFGIGDESFERLIVNNAFTGSHATASYSRSVPLSGNDHGHWAAGTLDASGEVAIMVPAIPQGEQRLITPLDYAALRDIGWQLNDTSLPNVPPVSPPPISPPPVTSPPTSPPPVASPPISPPPTAPVLAGSVRFAVGSDTGVASTVTAVNENGEPIWTLSPFGTFTGGVRTATADFNLDGVEDVVVATGPGTSTQVKIYSGATQEVLFTDAPFEPSFTGGLYVAVGDLNNDGTPEAAITPDLGGGPRVRLYSGQNFQILDDFFGIDDPNFRGGARVGIGDINNDGRGDLLVAAGFGGGPRVAGYNGRTLGTTDRQKLFGDFFAFEQSLRNGVFIASADVNNDDRADVLIGGGPGGGPRVTVFSGASLLNNNRNSIANFFAGDVDNRGGIRLTTSDVNGDGRTDIVTGSGQGAGSRVTVYSGRAITLNAPAILFEGDIYPGYDGGIFVG